MGEGRMILTHFCDKLKGLKTIMCMAPEGAPETPSRHNDSMSSKRTRVEESPYTTSAKAPALLPVATPAPYKSAQNHLHLPSLPAGQYQIRPDLNLKEDDFHGDDTERDDQDTDQEDSRKEEADSKISLEEVCEHEETFSETGDVYEDVDEGEACSQSGETEDREESYVEERAWCDYSDLEDNQLGDIEEEAENRHGFAKEEKSLSEAGEDEDEYEADHQPHYICFSGHEQRPEAYLRWEQDVEDWFQHHNIQEEEKLIIAEDTLTKNAFWHWDLEANYWLDDHPSKASWADMKEILREEYVVDAEINGNDYFKSQTRKVKLNKAHDPNQESKLFIKGKTELTSSERFNGPQVDPTPQAKTQELSTKPLPKSHKKGKPGKFPKHSKPVEPICYRCHKEGHYAIICPTRLVVTANPLEAERESPYENIAQSVCKFPTSGIMHLSWSSDVDTDVDTGINMGQEDVGSRLTQEGIIPEPDPQEELGPATSDPLKLEDVSDQAHEEEEPPDQSQNIQAVPLEAPIKVPHQQPETSISWIQNQDIKIQDQIFQMATNQPNS
ncbi:hypothetical protein Bca4012_027823 [Brassica carinata]